MPDPLFQSREANTLPGILALAMFVAVSIWGQDLIFPNQQPSAAIYLVASALSVLTALATGVAQYLLGRSRPHTRRPRRGLEIFDDRIVVNPDTDPIVIPLTDIDKIDFRNDDGPDRIWLVTKNGGRLHLPIQRIGSIRPACQQLSIPIERRKGWLHFD